MKSLLPIPLLLLGTLPQAKAQVDPEVLKMCALVADYMGCIKANLGKFLNDNQEEASSSILFYD